MTQPIPPQEPQPPRESEEPQRSDADLDAWVRGLREAIGTSELQPTRRTLNNVHKRERVIE